MHARIPAHASRADDATVDGRAGARGVSPRAAADTRHPGEYSRLEMLLAERAREAQEQRVELGRIKALLRDATLDFERVLAQAEPFEKIELARQRDAAVIRALEAEASRAEAVFRLDELMGHVADMAAREPLPASPVPVLPAPEPDASPDVREQLQERIRHLEANAVDRQAELERAGALCGVAQQELCEARLRVQALERELAATAEHQANADTLAESLRDTRRLLAEFARMFQRVARGVDRRESALDASLDANVAE